MGLKERYVGDEAQSKRGILDLNRPLKKGLIQNWEEIEKIYHHIFYNELKVAPEEHPLLLSESALNLKKDREKLAQIMFEKFDTPALLLYSSSTLSVFASGRTTALSLDSGYDTSLICPVYEGFLFRNAAMKQDFGGNELTDYLMKLLNERGYSFNTLEREIVDDIKEKKCLIFSREEKQRFDGGDLEPSYELPDGQVITLASEKFISPEALFQPSLLSREEESIDQLVYKSINKCEVELRKDFSDNIILSGGNTMFNGFTNRLDDELNRLAPTNRIRVIAPPERKYSTWIGASVVSSMSYYKIAFTSKRSYDEDGPFAIHKRSF